MIRALLRAFARWWAKVATRYDSLRVGDKNYLTKREKFLLDHWDNELLIVPLGNEALIIKEKGERLKYKPRAHAN